MQAVRDMQGDMTGHPSDSFSISLFMLLLSLADRDIVSMVARSPDLLLTLVRMTSKCLESRYNLLLFVPYKLLFNSVFERIIFSRVISFNLSPLITPSQIITLLLLFHQADLPFSRKF